MIPDDALLDEINRLADDDSPPTATEFEEEAEYSVGTVKNRWGSWNAALQEAGFTPNRRVNISDKALLNEISRLANGESPPTAKDFEEEAEYSRPTVTDRWGSWNAALQEAGFTPNQKRNIQNKTLLKTLREGKNGRIAPSYREGTTTRGSTTCADRFENWWRASVQAGLQPHHRRPLTHNESREFFEATIKQPIPQHQLIGLLEQFTGLPPRLVPELSPNWIRTPGENTVITVPANKTRSGQTWTFKVPDAWNDGSGERQETGLSGLLTWVLEQYGSIGFTSSHTIERVLYRIAQDAGLENREKTHLTDIGVAPAVQPTDLRATGGIQMARNGAPARRIRRHLGIEHTGWDADVEDFFLWLYVHEGYEHPEYDPPDVVLDSVL